jgi:hypothetical protein
MQSTLESKRSILRLMVSAAPSLSLLQPFQEPPAVMAGGSCAGVLSGSLAPLYGLLKTTNDYGQVSAYSPL